MFTSHNVGRVSLREPWQHVGSFWRPRGTTNKVGGTLSFTPGQHPQLYLTGSFGVRRSLTQRGPSSILANTGFDVPVSVCRAKAYKQDRKQKGITYRSDVTFINAEIPYIDLARFEGLQLSFDGLEEWFGHDPFGKHNFLVERKDTENTLEFVMASPHDFTLPGQGTLMLEMHRWRQIRAFEHSAGFIYRMVMRVQFEEEKSWEHVALTIDRLQAMFMVFFGRGTKTKSIHVTMKDASQEHGIRTAAVLVPPTDTIDFDPYTEHLVKFLDMRPGGFQLALTKWFENAKGLDLVYGMVAAELRSPSVSGKARMFNAATCAEALHRSNPAYPKRRYVTGAEMSRVAKRIRQHLREQEVDEPLRKRIGEMIGNANGPSFVDRVKDLFSQLPVGVIEWITNDADRFAEVARNSRNVTAHLDYAKNREVFPDDRMNDAADALFRLVIVHLLHMMGRPFEVIKSEGIDLMFHEPYEFPKKRPLKESLPPPAGGS